MPACSASSPFFVDHHIPRFLFCFVFLLGFFLGVLTLLSGVCSMLTNRWICLLSSISYFAASSSSSDVPAMWSSLTPTICFSLLFSASLLICWAIFILFCFSFCFLFRGLLKFQASRIWRCMDVLVPLSLRLGLGWKAI